MSDNAVLIAAR